MCSKKLNRWYKNVLSGFTQAKESREIHQYDHKVKKSNINIRVPIVLMENYGNKIAIDDKHIKGRYHTIISNIETSKIIVMARTTKSRELYDIIRKHFTIKQMMEVKVVTKDAAESYDWLSRQAFPNAVRVLDKWHVLKWVFDAMHGYRNELKNNYIVDQMKQQKQLDIKYQIALKKAKKEGRKISRKSYKLTPTIHDNGDDTKQLLTRSRYLLYKYESEWNSNQIKRAQILFDTFPKLFDIYILVIEFREWYSKLNIGESRLKLEQSLLEWIETIRKFKSTHLKALATSIKRHRGQILNYFILGYSNATAEALNRNIKRFIGVNYGIRDLNFFYFRLNTLHSRTSK